MKKHFFSKYIALLVSLCFASFLMLVGFLAIYSKSYFTLLDEEKLETAARNVGQSVAAMMDLTGQDFDYLLENEKDLIYAGLSSQIAGGVQIFITDGVGNVVLSPISAFRDKKLSASQMTQCTVQARQGKIFSTSLEGIFPEERMCRVVLLEKEFSDQHKQRVGAVIISMVSSSSQTYLAGLAKSFVVASLFVLVAVLLSFYLLTRALVRPMKILSDAAEKFARGNFSSRLPEGEGGDLTPLFRAFNQMAQRVEENENLRQTFVSNVSHDLRTPLTTIGGFVQNMQSGVIPVEKQGHYFGIINDEVARLSRLVQTLLETSRMTAGERKFNFLPMDLCELSRITLLSFEERIVSKELEVSFDCDEDSITVRADRDAIQQVMYNLIDNAIKFTPNRGELSIRVTLQGAKALFCVENSGDGIPEEELKQLFDRFYKSDRSRGLDKKGMGLGLFIAKSIVDAHGEEIWVESKVGDFTRFFFSLPLEEK